MCVYVCKCCTVLPCVHKMSSYCRVDVEEYMCKAGKVVSPVGQSHYGSKLFVLGGFKSRFLHWRRWIRIICMLAERVCGHGAARQRGRRA